MLVLFELQKGTECHQAQLQKLARYKRNESHRQAVIDRMTNTVHKMDVYGTQNAIIKGVIDDTVNTLGYDQDMRQKNEVKDYKLACNYH
jgi:hypothetical protein